MFYEGGIFIKVDMKLIFSDRNNEDEEIPLARCFPEKVLSLLKYFEQFL
jgi:hypothetical protein